MPAATILMCPPDHYGILYEINPWMDRRVGSEPAESLRQWSGAARHARRTRRDRRIARTAGRLAGPRLHRERRARRRRSRRQRPVPSRGEARRDAAFRRLVLVARIFRHHPPRRPLLRRRRRCPSSAAILSSPATDSAATPAATTGSAIRSASRRCLWNSSIPDSITSTPVSAPLADGEAIYYPGAFDDYGRSVLSSRNPPISSAVSADEAASFSLQRRGRGEIRRPQ